MYKHYIRHDESSRVIKGFSSAFEQPLQTDICICEDGGRHFEWQGNINPPMYLECGCPKYKNTMELMTEADIAYWESCQPTPPKTEIEVQEENTAILWVEIQRIKGEI